MHTSKQVWVVAVVAAILLGGAARWVRGAARAPSVSSVIARPASDQQGLAGRAARRAVELARRARISGNVALLEQADIAARRALSVEPHQLDALKVELLVQQNAHRFVDVARTAAQLAKENGNDSFFRQIEGDAEVELGRYEDAERSYDAMMDIRPEGTGYERVGYLHFLEGDPDGALAAYRMAATSTPRDEVESLAWILCDMGDVFLSRGEPAHARAYYETALGQVPAYARALSGKGLALRSEGALADASVALEAAVRASPKPIYKVQWADALVSSGNSEQASRLYQQALNEAVDDARLSSQILSVLGTDPARAERLAREEYQRRQDVFTEDTLAFALYRNGKLAEARASSVRAIRMATPDVHLSFHAGLIAAAAGDASDSAFWLGRALRQSPALLPGERTEAARVLARFEAESKGSVAMENRTHARGRAHGIGRQR